MALASAFPHPDGLPGPARRQAYANSGRRFTTPQENGNKLIVFDDDRHAIFDTCEIVILCGTKVLKPRGVPETITKEDILQKYGVLLE